MHAVTSYSKKSGHSRVPDPKVGQRALEAGADPNFSFHGSTPWEETLTGVLSQISLFEFEEEVEDSTTSWRRKWETDSKTWAKIMKIFLEHGASPIAMSKPHYGQPRRRALAIAQRFPAPLAVEGAEIKSMIGDVLARSRPRDYDQEILQQTMATPPDQNASKPIDESKASQQSVPVSSTTYGWVISWFSSSRKGRR